MTKAKEHNLSVIILNPNQTSYIDEKSTDTEDTNRVNNEENVTTENTTSMNIDDSVVAENITSMNTEEGVAAEGATSSDTEAKPIVNEEKSPNNHLISFYLSSDPLPRPLTKKIPNLSTNREHILYVYDNIISKSPAKNFYIVAHSAGGDGLMYLLRKRQDIILSKSIKIAFTDSVHSLLPLETKEIKNFLKANAIHFIASDEPMGTPIDYVYDFSQIPACQEVSAGHPKHEYTSGHCVEGVFQFFFPSEQIDKTKL
jgi:hypothetical protein